MTSIHVSRSKGLGKGHSRIIYKQKQNVGGQMKIIVKTKNTCNWIVWQPHHSTLPIQVINENQMQNCILCLHLLNTCIFIHVNIYLSKKNYVLVRLTNCNVWLPRLWSILLKDIKSSASIMFWAMAALLNEGIEDYKWKKHLFFNVYQINIIG